MRIYGMATNRLRDPMGFLLNAPRLSYKVDQTDAKRQTAARIRIAMDAEMTALCFDSGKRADLDSLGFVPDLALTPRTRYWWDVEVFADDASSARSAPAFFETGKMQEPWAGQWITAPVVGNMVLTRRFTLPQDVRQARMYIVGLGLYELYCNGSKVGDELLAPFCNAYDRWIQLQTYDVGDLLVTGDNELRVMLGDGWYMGRFGFKGKRQLYGDAQALRCELHITLADGTRQTILSDTDWQATESPVRSASIYDGEAYDATFVPGLPMAAVPYAGLDDARLVDRLSPPVRVCQRLTPKEILTTPAGETVLDLGQEITGYLEFTTRAPAGTELKLSYFEILQDGNFYRDNLRSAQQIQTYIADGQPATVRPHFTFFGFRYVKLEGFTAARVSDFCGCVVHSDIVRSLTFSCANEKVNRLAENVMWGQRGNFLDVPTDCPQRDERMGWTGDAQAFSGTACFQMESQAFFAKYLYDMQQEQDKRQGSVPYVVPSVGVNGDGSCAWSDAATVIPWNLFLFYGDLELLRTQYSNMRDWVEWIYRTDEASGSKRLWHVGFHFADWLALDTKDGSAMGGTDMHYIASAYYYYSTSLLLKAAVALGYTQDIQRYTQLQAEIRQAIQREYFTPSGRLAQTTQTGYICALFMDFAPQEHRALLTRLLALDFEESNGQLRTGFVGTAYLCRTLSQIGLNALAYSLLLREDYPGWLYEVSMGATTIWERWNSVLPDGHMSDTGMNSLNHYAYGAVMEWVCRDVVGINPVEEAPGFRRALLKPLPDERLAHAEATYESAAGQYASAWRIDRDTFRWTVTIPFNATATLVFPRAEESTLRGLHPNLALAAQGGQLSATLDAGTYTFQYPLLPVGPQEQITVNCPI